MLIRLRSVDPVAVAGGVVLAASAGLLWSIALADTRCSGTYWELGPVEVQVDATGDNPDAEQLASALLDALIAEADIDELRLSVGGVLGGDELRFQLQVQGSNDEGEP